MELVTLVAVLLLFVSRARGHGRLIEPPSRSSMWRFGFPTPRNSDDHSLDCGGLGVLWSATNRGHCGLCGDPYTAPIRQNEAGGVYATGTIGRRYTQGQIIPVRIEITVAHGGWSEFRICPNNDIYHDPSQGCLDRHVLASPSGTTRFYHRRVNGIMALQLVIPRGVTCSQCVFQWTWNTDSSNNCNQITGENCCVGCGPQERFVNCADVSVGTGAGPGTGSLPTRRPSPIGMPENFQPIGGRSNTSPPPTTQGTRLPDGFRPLGGHTG